MSTAALRREFEDLIRRDLLGPAGGEQEIVTEQSVRNRYLLGMLAPLKRIEEEEEEEPLGELADGSADSVEEGIAEPSTPANRSIAPSTFGLSFCLDLTETAFEVGAFWGQYLRDQDAEGKPIWKRYPRGGRKTIALKEGNLAPGPRNRRPRRSLFVAESVAGMTIGASHSFFPTSRQRIAREIGSGFSRQNFRSAATLPAVQAMGTFQHWTPSLVWKIKPTRCSIAARWSLPVDMEAVSSGN